MPRAVAASCGGVKLEWHSAAPLPPPYMKLIVGATG